MPPIDNGIKQRKGYQSLSDDITIPSDAPEVAEVDTLLTQTILEEQDKVNTGWFPLIWSFAASSGLTVSVLYYSPFVCSHLDAP